MVTQPRPMSDLLSSNSSGPPKDECTGTVCTHLAAWCLPEIAFLWCWVLPGQCSQGLNVPYQGRASHWLHTGAVGPLPIFSGNISVLGADFEEKPRTHRAVASLNSVWACLAVDCLMAAGLSGLE